MSRNIATADKRPRQEVLESDRHRLLPAPPRRPGLTRE